MRKILYLASLVAVAAITIIACQREVNNFENNSNNFDVATAKEWWYGTFRKTADFSRIKYENIFTPNISYGKGINSKSPSWKRGKAYSIGDIQVVEFPLYYSSTVCIFPDAEKLTTDERVRIAKATRQRLLLLKEPNGKVSVRIMMIIPSPEYAKKRNYDISDITYLNRPSDFSGWCITKTWNEDILDYIEIKDGKKQIRLSFKERDQAPSNFLETQSCYPTTVPVTVNICVDPVLDGDEPVNTNGSYCENWLHYTVWQVQWACENLNNGGNGGSPWENCLQTSSPEDCLCEIFDLNCNNNGNGGENPPSAPDLITNSVTDTCIRNSVDYAIYQGCKNEITSFIQSTFDTSSTYHILFLSGPIPAHPTKVAYTTTGPLSPQSLDQTNTIIMFNTNILSGPSKEYVVATILHEAIHAWINYQYPSPPTNAQQHNQMTGSDRFNRVLNALLEMCPYLNTSQNMQDAIDLVWGGLEESAAYVNLPIADKQRIQQTNLAYKNGTKGSPCN